MLQRPIQAVFLAHLKSTILQNHIPKKHDIVRAICENEKSRMQVGASNLTFTFLDRVTWVWDMSFYKIRLF